MNKSYYINFQIAEIFCRLIIDDKKLFNYFKANYWFFFNKNKEDNKIKIQIEIKKNIKYYQIKIKPEKLLIKVNIKKNLLFKDIEWIVRTMIQYNLLKYGVIFIHSSAFFYKNKVYAFLGTSGKGKSTIIKNFSKNNLLSDDILILKKEKESFFAYQSPFEKKRVNKKIKKRIKIKKMFLLKQGKELVEKKIAIKEVVNYFLADNYIPKLPKIKLDGYSELIFNLIKKIEIVSLFFPKKFNKNFFLSKYG